jgi:hypothetical protein
MNPVFLICAAWFGAVLVGGGWLAAHPPRRPAPLAAGRARVREVVDQSVQSLGRLPTAAVVYFVGAGLILAVCWPLGILSHGLEDAVDWPVFRWSRAHQVHGWWYDAWWKLTNIGKPRITQGVDAVAAVLFALIWARRRQAWWFPLLVFAGAYALEKYGQIILQDVVHRGHPPTTLGTYPSGGCARVLIVYGLLVFMTMQWRWPSSRLAWRVGMVLIAFLWSVQAFARLNNLEHWITDVVGGTVFGLMGLGVMVGCVRVFTRPSRAVTHERAATQRATVRETPWRLSVRG